MRGRARTTIPAGSPRAGHFLSAFAAIKIGYRHGGEYNVGVLVIFHVLIAVFGAVGLLVAARRLATSPAIGMVKDWRRMFSGPCAQRRPHGHSAPFQVFFFFFYERDKVLWLGGIRFIGGCRGHRFCRICTASTRKSRARGAAAGDESCGWAAEGGPAPPRGAEWGGGWGAAEGGADRFRARLAPRSSPPGFSTTPFSTGIDVIESSRGFTSGQPGAPDLRALQTLAAQKEQVLGATGLARLASTTLVAPQALVASPAGWRG